MTTATVPHLFSLSKEEYRKVIDEAEARCEAERKIASAQHIAREAAELAALSDPHANHYLTWKGERKYCVLVVRHHLPKPKSFPVTRDGSGYPNIFLPFSRTDELPESDGDFLLAVFALPFVEWMETKDGGKDYAAAQRYRELFGVTMPLSADRAWTDEQIATWKRLDKLRSSINWRIQTARMPQIKRRELTLTRNGAA